MEHYIAVFKNSVATDLYSKKQLSNIKPEFVHFICRKENIVSYGYGSHDKYIICDNAGKVTTLNVGGYSIVSFQTHGTQGDYMLTWTILNDGIEETYSLHCDLRWYVQPKYDQEWSDPIKDTIPFVNDIRIFGLNARKAMDELSRRIFRQEAEIENALHRHTLLRNIDFEKSGVSLNYRQEHIPHYHKDYKNFYERLKPDADRAIHFLKEEHDTRERIISQINKGNEKYESVASSLVHVYLKSGVSTVVSDQFYACRSVETITLPASVQMIVHSAFNFRQKLSSVKITSPKKVNLIADFPSPGIMTFNGCFYVHKELLESYKSDMFWDDIKERIFGL
jgi:very-short-patch-repair endonuclease